MTKYKDFTPDDIAKCRAGCEEWKYFPLGIGLDALARIEAMNLQIDELKSLLEYTVRHISHREPPHTVDEMHLEVPLTFKDNCLRCRIDKALGDTIAEKLVDPQQNCDHEWSHIEDHHVYCPKCKKTADLCWTCEAEKQNVGGVLVCLKCRGN